MSQNPYPYLGFNPVPGAPDDVAGLRGQISTAAEAVKETNQLLNSLRNSNENVWQGEGGDAFRADFDATLAQDLGYAQNSLEKAVGLLAEWHTDLVGFQGELGEFAPAIRSFTEGAQAPGIATKLIDGVPNVVDKIPLMPSAVSRSMGDFTSFFEDFGQASKLEAGTSAAGIELFSRAGKAGLGLFNIGNIGNG
ncbi:hypothetical protein ACIBG0_14580 [Nocardia sp. NPDC050630]|uniref:hypothetical protein n=1 Tax=Nocardia sp. NPDC050630 TaxID=3364321 RepID=UPI003791336A